MEKILLKMARQLNALDEASLMALWDRYLTRVQDFDGSQEWEEASIVLSLIQAVRAKNQLFNTKLEERQASAFPKPEHEDLRPWRRMDTRSDREKERDREAARPKKPATVLAFKPRG